MKKHAEVVAALIWEKNRFLICQRPPQKARGTLWEFVGGKIEPGETPAEALIRECREELDITVSVGSLFMEVTHDYPDLEVHLRLYHAEIAEGRPKMLEHMDLRWITPEEIPGFQFCPADVVILQKLQKVYKKKTPAVFFWERRRSSLYKKVPQEISCGTHNSWF